MSRLRVPAILLGAVLVLSGCDALSVSVREEGQVVGVSLRGAAALEEEEQKARESEENAESELPPGTEVRGFTIDGCSVPIEAPLPTDWNQQEGQTVAAYIYQFDESNRLTAQLSISCSRATWSKPDEYIAYMRGDSLYAGSQTLLDENRGQNAAGPYWTYTADVGVDGFDGLNRPARAVGVATSVRAQGQEFEVHMRILVPREDAEQIALMEQIVEATTINGETAAL